MKNMVLKNRWREVLAVAFSAVFCAVSLTACGGSLFPKAGSGSSRKDSYETGGYYIAQAETAAAMAAPEMAAPMEMRREETMNFAADAAMGSESGTVPSVTEGRKLIRTVSMSIRLDSDKELQNTVTQLTSIANQFGGYVTNNDMSFESSYAGGHLTIQVPKKDVDAFIQAIQGTGYKITGMNDSSRDVTNQYVDTEARIKVQEQKIENYQKYLEQAENVTDTLEISDRLNDAIADMESYKATMNTLNQQIEYTEISVHISCDTAETHETFSERVQRTLRNIGEGFVDTLLEGLEWFTESVAVLIFALPLIWVVIRVIMAAFRAGRYAAKNKGAGAADAGNGAGKAGGKEKRGFFGRKKKAAAADAAVNQGGSGAGAGQNGAAGAGAPQAGEAGGAGNNEEK